MYEDDFAFIILYFLINGMGDLTPKTKYVMLNSYYEFDKEGLFMIFGKHINRYYLRYSWALLIGLASLIRILSDIREKLTTDFEE